MKAHYSSFLSAIWKRPTAAAAKAIPAVILSLSCLALASCGDGGGKELLSGELTTDGSMNIGGTTVSVHKGIVRAGRVSYGLVPSGSRVFAKKMNDGSVLITVNGERRYPETQKVNTGRGGTLPQPKLMGK